MTPDDNEKISLHGYDLTLPALVERELKARNFFDGNVKVFNAGIPGYASPHQFIKLAMQILPLYEPDLVIFYDGWNDYYYYYRTKLNSFEYTFYPFNAHELYAKLDDTEN